MSEKRPTQSQAQLIDFFDGGPVPTRRCTPGTYRACVANGWIEPTDAHPYHRATSKGIEAVASIGAPRVANVAAATAERRRIGDRGRAAILREHGWTCTPPEGYKE